MKRCECSKSGTTTGAAAVVELLCSATATGAVHRNPAVSSSLGMAESRIWWFSLEVSVAHDTHTYLLDSTLLPYYIVKLGL